MYNCPNCGAGMRYDIPTKKLVCDHCLSTCEIGEHPAQLASAEQDAYDATVFTCPQCGGRILSTDHAASDFCTYCGASVTLEGRLASEKKPDLILPFSLTKEQCRDAYRKYVRTIWCLPGEYKTEQFLDKFEGIYIPFWAYRFSQKGPGLLSGTRVSGSYREYLKMNFELNNKYNWILYDAASQFDDEISSAISTFTESGAVEFDPAYMSGFYADIPDVNAGIYQGDAEDDANFMTYENITHSVYFKGISFDTPHFLSKSFNTKYEGVKSALCPVWFVTWRKRNRVAYAAVNGQNGTCAADLPVSWPKYLLFSLLMAIPCALLFLALPVIMAKTMLSVALVFSMVMMRLYYKVACETVGRELHVSDKGYNSRREQQDPVPGQIKKQGQKKRKYSGTTNTVTQKLITFGFSVIFLVVTAALSNDIELSKFTDILQILVIPAAVIGAVLLCSAGLSLSRRIHSYGILADTLILGASVAAAVVIRVLNPVHDYYYYFGAVLILAGIAAAALGLIRQYNKLCTHPIPEYFNREEAGKDA